MLANTLFRVGATSTEATGNNTLAILFLLFTLAWTGYQIWGKAK